QPRVYAGGTRRERSASVLRRRGSCGQRPVPFGRALARTSSIAPTSRRPISGRTVARADQPVGFPMDEGTAPGGHAVLPRAPAQATRDLRARFFPARRRAVG